MKIKHISTTEEKLEKLRQEVLKELEELERLEHPSFKKAKYSIDSPPGTIDLRVFIGGKYSLMPILREIENVVFENGFQPIIAYDFNIPRDKTREYTLRLLFQHKHAIFEVTIIWTI